MDSLNDLIWTEEEETEEETSKTRSVVMTKFCMIASCGTGTSRPLYSTKQCC